MIRGTRGIGRRRLAGTADKTSWDTALSLVPDSGSLEEFVDAVAAYRGRPIKVLDCDLPADAPSGVWIQLADFDYVVCVTSVSGQHRRVVICHEMAHMLLGHSPVVGVIDTSFIAPSIDVDVAARFFHRQGYQDRIEAEAEALATVLAAELSERMTSTAAAQDNISERLR